MDATLGDGQHAPMGEYGGVLRSTGGGTRNPVGDGNDLVDAFKDVVDRVLGLPPEVLIVIAAVVIIGGFLVMRRGL